jgi:hypothetical protein
MTDIFKAAAKIDSVIKDAAAGGAQTTKELARLKRKLPVAVLGAGNEILEFLKINPKSGIKNIYEQNLQPLIDRFETERPPAFSSKYFSPNIGIKGGLRGLFTDPTSNLLANPQVTLPFPKMNGEARVGAEVSASGVKNPYLGVTVNDLFGSGGTTSGSFTPENLRVSHAVKNPLGFGGGKAEITGSILDRGAVKKAIASITIPLPLGSKQ